MWLNLLQHIGRCYAWKCVILCENIEEHVDNCIDHFRIETAAKIKFEPGRFGTQMPWIHLSGLSFSYLTNLHCKRHTKASSDFAERILGDHQYSLHDGLSKARSHTSTRSRFKLLPHIGTLSSWRYRDPWSTETQSWTITYRICLEPICINSPSLIVLLT